MARKTKYIVFVPKEVMVDPAALFDAAYNHLVTKAHPLGERKRFMGEFLKAPTDERKLAVIDAWVQVRDVETFPFRNELRDGPMPEPDAETPPDTEMPPEETKTEAPTEEESREDTPATRGVPVDSNPEQGKEQGVARDGSDQGNGVQPKRKHRRRTH